MLREFVSDLRRLPPLARPEAEMAALLSAASSAGDPQVRLPFRAGRYTRTCAYRDDRFEVLLLDWAAGSVSPIHDHGGRHCWLTVLHGRLHVEDYARLGPRTDPGLAWLTARGSRTLEAGGLDLRSGALDLHRVAAVDRTVTLHVYARPLDSFLVYDERSHRCSPAESTYDARLPIFTEAAR